MKLVIVESPAKCSKIKGFLGDGYNVVASMGHIRALEQKLSSVGIENGWNPKYMELSTKKEAIAKLRSAAKGADEIFLASDPDREGEGIAWHICFILKLNPATTKRILFHEITKPAIQSAIARPLLLDMNKVNAQQARSMLDLLVGFTISQVLWSHVAPKVSAGRCQSPALRLVVERDTEVENHTASAFWTLRCNVTPTACESFGSLLELRAEKDVLFEADARAVLQTMYNLKSYELDEIKESISLSQPPKPYITSTLQQEASTSHGLSPKSTMQAAQKLYESGHITYMRTDNPLISTEAATQIRSQIESVYGASYLGVEGQYTLGVPAKKTKTNTKSKSKAKDDLPEAQAAHEAIRPTHPENKDIDVSDPVQKIVYGLIWKRAIQCQMAVSETYVRKYMVQIDGCGKWIGEQTKPKFAGWKVLDMNARDEEKESVWNAWTPYAIVGATFYWKTIAANEQFTKPRSRFTEASLIAELEKRGIGRPSTFASIVGTLTDRNYVEKTNVDGMTKDSKHLLVTSGAWPPVQTLQTHKLGAEKNKLCATSLGKSVCNFLVREYSDLFNYDFTAAMESDLDKIAQGVKEWKELLQTTWDTYKDRYHAQKGSGGGDGGKSNRERILSPCCKIISTTKGLLFVREQASDSPKSAKAVFASVPPRVDFDSATMDDFNVAFENQEIVRAGEWIGELNGDEIRKKKGPYGFYIECKKIRIPYKSDESLEKLKERLQAKITFANSDTGTNEAYVRKLGDFTIRKGPYGLYFFKHTLKRASFVKFPTGLDPEKVNSVDLTELYKDGLNKKKFGKKKANAGAGAETG